MEEAGQGTDTQRAGGHGMSGQERAGRGAEGQGAAGRPRPGTFFIRTYGCQMNLYDSGRMADLLAARGMKRADAPEGADLIVLNTCHIREKAAEKVYSELGRLARLRRPDGGAPASGGRRLRRPRRGGRR